MSFMQQWQSRAYHELNGLEDALTIWQGHNLLIPTYSTLAGLALWPIVELFTVAATLELQVPTVVEMNLVRLANNHRHSPLSNQLNHWYKQVHFCCKILIFIFN